MTSATTTKHLKFSKQRLEALPPAAKRVEYHYDTECRGLAISVGTSGRKTFLLYRKVRGVPRRISIGAFPDITVEQARTQAARLNGDIAAGLLPNPTAASMTFRAAFEDYMEKHSAPSKRTSKEDIALFERNLTGKRHWEGLAHRKLLDINGALLRSVHREMGETPIAANRTLALVSSVFSHAIREGLYEQLNPARTVRKYPEQSRARFVRKDEMRWLFKAVAQEPDLSIADLVQLAIYTGARRGNLLAMRWEEIDLQNGEWRIGRTKNGDAQTIPLSEPASTILGRRKEAAPPAAIWVFPSCGKSGHIVEPKKGWRRILQRATALRLRDILLTKNVKDEWLHTLSRQESLEFPAHAIETLSNLAAARGVDISQASMLDLRMHDLRRTVGSWLASSGASLPLIGKVLNHKTPQATQVYARFMLDPIRQALNQVANDVQNART